jgi:hypothetical protein
MLTGIIDSIRKERATFLHEVNFIREMANEDVIANQVDKAESQYVRETTDELIEAKEMVDEMPSDTTQDDAEINKIMEATEDMSFDEMIGLIND